MRKLLLLFLAAGLILSVANFVSANGDCIEGGYCSSTCTVVIDNPQEGDWEDPVLIQWHYEGTCRPIEYYLAYQEGTCDGDSWVKIDDGINPAGNNQNSFDWTSLPEDGDYCIAVNMDQLSGPDAGGVSGVFHLDTTAPVLTKTVGEPKVACEGEECDYYVTTETPITLECEDEDGSGVNFIEYTINDGEPVKVYNDEVTFSFAEPSQHVLEAYCVDNVGKESDVDSEIFFVDNQAPSITKTVVGPQEGQCPPEPESEDKCYVAAEETEINVEAVDDGEHAVGFDECYYWYYVGEQRFPDSGVYSTFPIAFGEESAHELHLVCKDLLGNSNNDVEIFYVDTSAPNTHIGYQGPYHEEEGVEWIDGVSTVVLTVDELSEPHPNGVDETFYRYEQVDESYCFGEGQWETTSKESEDWTVYEEPFSMDESCHVVEAYSVDNLGNEEDVQYDFVFVDKTAPETVKNVGSPSHECGVGDSKCQENWDWIVTMDTQIKLSCEDNGPHPSGTGDVCYRWFLDGTLVMEEGSNEEGWICLNQDEVVVQFNEESEHQLDFYCVDNVNKTSEVDSELFKVEGKEFVIKLKEKWNLISIPFNLIGSDVEEVFDQLGDNLEIVWGYDEDGWHVYSPDAPSDLETVEPGYGYWVKVKEDAELKIGGSLLSPGPGVPPSRELQKGWNLIGHYGLDEKSAYCSLLSLVDTNIGHPRWSALFGYDAVSDEFESLNTLDTTYPGKGYWVEMDVDDYYSPATACYDWD